MLTVRLGINPQPIRESLGFKNYSKPDQPRAGIQSGAQIGLTAGGSPKQLTPLGRDVKETSSA